MSRKFPSHDKGARFSDVEGNRRRQASAPPPAAARVGRRGVGAEARPVLAHGALAALLCIVAGGASAWSALAAVLALASAAACAGVVTRRATRMEQEALRAGATAREALREFAAAPLPIWQRHLETVRCAGDEEVARIARAATGFLARMGETGGAADTSLKAQELAAELASAQREVDALVGSLRASEDGRRRVVQEIRDEADRLHMAAGEIHQVAMHTRMVTLNATIEAARAGAAGRPFATIVTDMRALAQRTAQSSDDFGKATRRLYAMAESALAGGGRAADGSASTATEALVQDLLARLRAMGEELRRCEDEIASERHGLRGQIHGVLEALQFQDRGSQILAHLAASVGALQQQLDHGDGPPPDATAWLQAMAQDYSTAEEDANHTGDAAAEARGAALTFF